MEKGEATHSNSLAWRISWTEKPVGYSLQGQEKLDVTDRLTHNNNNNTQTHTHIFPSGSVVKNPAAVQEMQVQFLMPGASTRDSTHDKVMRRRPGKQGRSGLQGF